jgi:hypothetical protein
MAEASSQAATPRVTASDTDPAQLTERMTAPIAFCTPRLPAVIGPQHQGEGKPRDVRAVRISVDVVILQQWLTKGVGPANSRHIRCSWPSQRCASIGAAARAVRKN